MQLKNQTIAPALKALLEHLIDYAGMFPPAKLSIDQASANYQLYKHQEYNWMLRWLVIEAREKDKIPSGLHASLSLLSEVDISNAACIESKSVVQSTLPVYCEVPITKLSELDAVKKAGCLAKIRTGGIKPEAIPSTAEVAAFINACAERKLAFKATAGLHHPIRADHALTYEPDSARATMHGFINVLMASAFAWHGTKNIEPVLAEKDRTAFVFDDEARWRDLSLSAEAVRDARANFMHAIGSCSFDEPVNELKALHLI